jgi:hypothetical protein
MNVRVVPDDAATLVANAIGFDEFRVDAEPAAVLLVRGEARECEQGERAIAGTLCGQEVAMMTAAVLVDQLHPARGEPLEVRDLGRIDHVVDDARDH